MTAGAYTCKLSSIPTGLLWSMVIASLASGCVSRFEAKDESRFVLPDSEQMETVQRLDDSPGLPLMRMTSTSTAFTMRQWDAVPFNGLNLPLLSFSNGGMIASQVGPRPSAATLCARSGGCSSEVRVQLHRLGNDPDPGLLYESDGGTLLGRNGNQKGFLLERPNSDGSRDIGLVPWDAGPVEWLVEDGNVNAFGWISESGRLVYSTREVESPLFQLAVIEPDGERWTITESLPYSWVYPVIDSNGTDLFAVRLGDGYADVAHAPFRNLGEFRRNMRLRRMSDRVNLTRISQMMSACTGGSSFTTGILAWYSYEQGRMLLWDTQYDRIELLPQGSVAALPFSNRFNWLTTTEDGLNRVTLFVTDTVIDRLVDFPWVPRAASATSILMVEPRDGVLEIAELAFESMNPE